MALGIRFLPPVWETWIEFPTYSLIPSPVPTLASDVQGMSQYIKAISLSLSGSQQQIKAQDQMCLHRNKTKYFVIFFECNNDAEKY